mgnify:CR=1 FL=1
MYYRGGAGNTRRTQAELARRDELALLCIAEGGGERRGGQAVMARREQLDLKYISEEGGETHGEHKLRGSV